MSSPTTIEYDHSITCIDTAFQRPGFAACYLVEDQGRCALIDTGTWHTVDLIMQVLADKGLGPDSVDFIIPTHVHLDHAGGAGELMRRMPHARLVIHPRGARHMIEPAKLTAGATAVYGEEVFKRDYVELVPVPEERVIEADDGHEVQLGGRALRFLDTPGHASHHFCIWDERSKGLFSGDTFGLSYREFDTDNGAFVFPPTTPVQFKPEAWHDSLARIAELKPEQVFLTHYARVDEVPRLLQDLNNDIDALVAIAREMNGSEDRYQAIHDAIWTYLLNRMRRHGVGLSDEAIRSLLAMDLDLNTQGLEVWLDRQKR